MGIDPREVQKRFDRLTAILGDIATQADSQAADRCPYRDRHDLCTAKFLCRNQTQVEADADPIPAPVSPDPPTLRCGHDGRFDYRSAWETDPAAVERARQRLQNTRRKTKDDA